MYICANAKLKSLAALHRIAGSFFIRFFAKAIVCSSCFMRIMAASFVSSWLSLLSRWYKILSEILFNTCSKHYFNMRTNKYTLHAKQRGILGMWLSHYIPHEFIWITTRANLWYCCSEWAKLGASLDALIDTQSAKMGWMQRWDGGSLQTYLQQRYLDGVAITYHVQEISLPRLDPNVSTCLCLTYLHKIRMFYLISEFQNDSDNI